MLLHGCYNRRIGVAVDSVVLPQLREETVRQLRDHICLRDLGDYAAMNAVYAEYFPQDPPARYCIRADLVKPEFLVEIGSVAYLTA